MNDEALNKESQEMSSPGHEPAPEATPAASGSNDAEAGSAQEGATNEVFFARPMRSANRLMDALFKDDDFFYESARFAWVGAQDAKRLFLYGACKEVMKACVVMMEDKDRLKEEPEQPESSKSDRIGKLVLGAFIDTQTYRIRKMIELLSLLLLFRSHATGDEEYRIFLNAENVDLALARLEDFRELYGGQVISNTLESVVGFAERVLNDMNTLNVRSVWFLNPERLKNFAPDRIQKLKPGVFTSRKQLYLQAVKVANPDERVALGISYGRGYSQTSQSIHPLLGSHDYGREENTEHQLRQNFFVLGLLCMHVMRQAFAIAGEDDPDGLEGILGKNLERSKAAQLLQRFKKEMTVGDIVLTAWRDLGEVLEVQVGKYGDTACRVRYLSRAPLPNVPIDWLESQALLPLMPKSKVREMFTKGMNRPDQPEGLSAVMAEALKQPDEKLVEYAGKALLEMHRAGILVPMLVEQGYMGDHKSQRSGG